MKEGHELYAIMFTDIVGYTALMGKDEARALQILEKMRQFLKTHLEKFNGEFLKEIGDGSLSRFRSAVDAVGCALDIQRAILKDADFRIRIGIHVGDVVFKEGDIFGDAVNVASRIETLAATGGICVSENVYESIRNKSGITGIFLGAKSLKNVSEPVRVYGLTGEGLPAAEEIRQAAQRIPSVGLSPLVKLTVAAMIIAALAGLWYGVVQRQPAVEKASEERMALPLPDEPSVAVLPFDNLSGDPGQDYFSDGLTEDIITGLAKVPELFVIARNSSFIYKGKPVKVQQVSEELGVRYVLEGSVRRIEDKVRITVQLIDALNGRHLWAEKYDRDIHSIFSLMDEITKEIMTAMQVTVTKGAHAEIFSKGTSNLKAYEKFLQGRNHHYRFNKEDNLSAMGYFQEAVNLDPEYPIAYSYFADTVHRQIWLGPETDKKKIIGQAMSLVKKALSLDESLAEAHGLFGWLLTLTRQYDKAIAEAGLAVTLDPNATNTYGFLGFILNYAGRRDEAIAVLENALRRDPFLEPRARLFLGITYRDAGQYEKAIETCQTLVDKIPDFIFAHTCLASAYSLSGNESEARAAAAEVLRINPKFTLESLQALPYKYPEDHQRMLQSLQDAGL